MQPDSSLNDAVMTASLQMEGGRLANAAIVATFAVRAAYNMATMELPQQASLPTEAVMALLWQAFDSAWCEYLHQGEDSCSP